MLFSTASLLHQMHTGSVATAFIHDISMHMCVSTSNNFLSEMKLYYPIKQTLWVSSHSMDVVLAIDIMDELCKSYVNDCASAARYNASMEEACA